MPTIKISTALHQAVLCCLRNKLQLARQHFHVNFTEPKISYLQRGRAAGSAWLQHWEIRLNPILLQQNQQNFINQVVPHELAHLLVFHQFGKVRPHGAQWRFVMENLFLLPACRTHSFDIRSVTNNTFLYQCACQQHALSLCRHNRVLRGVGKYCCRCCGKQLTPLSEQNK